MVKRKTSISLPDELTTEILHRLPTTESVLESKSVCKGWRSVLAGKRIGLLFSITPCIWEEKVTRLYYREQINEEHLNMMFLDNNHDPDDRTYKIPSLRIVGSCNGLVCFYVPHDHIKDPVYIMNPTTGEHLHLPQITPGPLVTRWYHISVTGGFGYCQCTDEYKVVRIHLDGNVEVHTLGDIRGWRNVGVIPYTFRKSGIYAHRCIFWINLSEGNVNIVSFNLESETFQPHSPPPHQIPGSESPVDHMPALGMVLFGVQLLFYYKHEEVEGRIDLWIPISDENMHAWVPGGEWHWNLKTSIFLHNESLCTTYSPIALGRNNDILLWNHLKLMRYNTHTRTLTRIWWAPWWIKIEVIPHMRSNVSLKNFGGEWETCTHEFHATSSP